MKCKHHPNALLEEVSIKTEQRVPWSEERIKLYLDVQYCKECWTNHENGKPMVHDLIRTEQGFLEEQVDNYIQGRI